MHNNIQDAIDELKAILYYINNLLIQQRKDKNIPKSNTELAKEYEKLYKDRMSDYFSSAANKFTFEIKDVSTEDLKAELAHMEEWDIIKMLVPCLENIKLMIFLIYEDLNHIVRINLLKNE